MKRSLTKQERLRSRQDIDRVFENGRTVSLRGMKLVVAPNEVGNCRICVIPAKGHQNAVARNRTKRLAKEAFRLVKARLVPGNDFVIICFPGDYSYADRHEQLLQLLASAGAIDSRSDPN